MDATTQIWIVIKQPANLELKNQFLAWENMKYSHTHNNNHRLQMLTKGVNNQVDYQNHNALAPQRSLLYKLKDSIEVKCKGTHSATNSQLKTHLRLVNLTENAKSDTFKAPCCCFEYVLYTALTIV